MKGLMERIESDLIQHPLDRNKDVLTEARDRIIQLEKSLLMPASDIEYPRDIFHKLIKESPYAFYLFQWVPYQTDARKWRLKMCHDVKHKDGRIEYGIWPNGSSCGSFKDEDVEFIRISRSQMGGTYVDPRDEKVIG